MSLRPILPVACLLCSLACNGGSGPTASTCTAPVGPPIEHAGYLSADEVWSAESAHVITADLTVSKNVTLTLAPCADVTVQEGHFLHVQGQLIARGVASSPISIHGEGTSRFASLWIRAPGSAELAWVTVEGGGGPTNLNSGAAVIVEGEGFPPSLPVLVDHVTIRGSAGYGIDLRKWAGFAAGSTDLVVEGSGSEVPERPFPISMSLNAVGTIPAGRYTGNASDAIRLVGESPHYNVEIDDTIPDRGVPYQVGGNGAFGIITVAGEGGPTLTIEAGVTIRHHTTSSNIGGFFVGKTGTAGIGRVVAVGSAERPIVFAPAGESGPGAWEGITFNGPVAEGNRLEHVRIEDGGGHGGDSSFGCPPTDLASYGTDGALKIFEEPPEQFFRSSTIVRSKSFGVFRAWKGADVDFLPTNTFEEVAFCHQVLPVPVSGTCPDDPPCPK